LHYTSNYRSYRCKQYSRPEGRIYQLKQRHNSRVFNQEIQNFGFTSLSSLTTKHCDRHFLTAVPIIDIFMFMKAGCQVTSKN